MLWELVRHGQAPSRKVLRKLELRNRVDATICGLIAGGCPCNSNPACPLAAWLKGRDAP